MGHYPQYSSGFDLYLKLNAQIDPHFPQKTDLRNSSDNVTAIPAEFAFHAFTPLAWWVRQSLVSDQFPHILQRVQNLLTHGLGYGHYRNILLRDTIDETAFHGLAQTLFYHHSISHKLALRVHIQSLKRMLELHRERPFPRDNETDQHWIS
jgi:hypothetical protein